MNRIRKLSEALGRQQSNQLRLDDLYARINRAIDLSTALPLRIQLHRDRLKWQDFDDLRQLAHAHLPWALRDAGYFWRLSEEQYDPAGKYYSSAPSAMPEHTYVLVLHLEVPEADQPSQP